MKYIWKITLIYKIIEKFTNVVKKNPTLCYKIFTEISLLCVKYITSANTWKLTYVDLLAGLLIIMMLGCLLCLKNSLNIGSDFLPADGFTSSNSWMFQFLIAFEKKLFRISAFLASCVKVRSSSTSMIFSSWLCISRKKRLHSFPKICLFSFDFASNQVLLFIEKIFQNFLLLKKQFCYPNNCIQYTTSKAIVEP